MTVRLIKKSWWVDFSVDYTRYRKQSPENTGIGALAYEAVLRRKLANGEPISGRIDGAREHTQTFEKFAW
jgi:hypothetical protein